MKAIPDSAFWSANIGDADWIDGIIGDAFADYARIMDAARGTARPRPARTWLHPAIEASAVWLFGRKGQPSGVAVLKCEEGAMWIERLAVDPAVQGQGWGAFALDRIADLARSERHRAMRLYTGQPMTRLVAFYSLQGFRVTHTGPAPGGDDGVLRVFMEKQIRI